MQLHFKVIFLLLFLSLQLGLHSQELDYIPGEVLIQMQPDRVDRGESLLLNPSIAGSYTIEKNLFPELGIYLLSYNPNRRLSTVLDELSKEKDILYVQKNQKVSPRNTRPNDPLYLDQWYHSTIQSEEAWDVTTGGTDPRGRQVVMAVMDSGFDIDHIDFQGNVWVNEDEIPDDQIDNDNNGYIDDYRGWNPETRSDDHGGSGQGTVHGTNVAGIAGARGDNDEGVAGVAWDIKILFLSGLRTSVEIVEAMRYISETRQEFNESGGERGAFLVSTNISLGISNGMAEDFPIWCELYNVLGENGVLNVSAVDNLNSDVEINGDIPTVCTSEFLITVTNTDINNQIDPVAAFGNRSVDLGAPGTSNVTTSPNNSYNAVSGTSVAAPMVAGAIALLYTAPCETVADQSLIDPSGVALNMKSMIFNGAQPSLSLRDITTQGAVLNVFESIQSLDRNCNNEANLDNNVMLIPNYVERGQPVVLNYRSADEGEATMIKIFDSKGAVILERPVGRSFFGSNRISLNTTSELSAGVYFVSLILSDNTTISEKLVVY